MGSHLIEDIGVLVPQGVVVSISADQAYRSRDLWRAISQNLVFRLKSGPAPASMGTPQPLPDVTKDTSLLVEQNRLLMASLEEQRTQNAALLSAVDQQRRVLEMLAEKVSTQKVEVQYTHAPGNAIAPTTPKVEGTIVSGPEVPMFIPSSIKAENSKTRIATNRDESEADLEEARNKLRQLKALKQ